MRKLSVLPLLFLPGFILAQAQAPLDATFANNREFRIPVNPGSGAQYLKQLQLFVSTDQGRTWSPQAIIAPDQQKFHFRADRDGTYWFSVQSLDLNGKLYPPTMDRAQPSIKVIVDTQKPVVQMEALPPRPGEVGVSWTIRDDYFNASSYDAVRLEYRPSGVSTWLPLSVPQGATQYFWNPRSSSLIDVRLRARDRAGNVGEGSTTVSLSGAGAGNTGGHYLPYNQEVKPAAPPPVDTDILKLGAGERRFVNSKRVVLNCELKDFGPSGVSLVELWYTHDARAWNKGPDFRVNSGDEKDKQSITFDVLSEGIYGLTLLARSGVGLGDRPPQVGDRPHLWIEVDTTKPVVKLLGVIVGTGADKGKLTVNWDAQDKNLTANPITLSYAKSADGPWEHFASKLPNTGRYVWTLPTDNVPYQFHIKVEAIDKASNLGEAVTTDLVKVDLATPKVRILNVEPSSK